MNMSKDNIKKMVIILCSVVLFYELLENLGNIADIVSSIISLFFPFILGGAIAFIINVPMKHVEKHLFKKKKSEKFNKIRRATAVFITIVAFLGVMVFAMWIVIPEIANTVSDISSDLPKMFNRVSDKAMKIADKHPEIEEFVKNEKEINWTDIVDSVIGKLKNGAGTFVSSGIGFVSSIFRIITSFVIGLVFAIYILFEKERLSKQAKQVLYSFFSKKMAERIIRIGNIANQTFSGFLSGQCLEACILGTMFFFSMLILRIPYAMVMGVIISITALIPVVGAFIGCFIGVILILIDSPFKALVFIIMFLVLQMIEENLIYPHVVGNSVGLPSIWVLMAVTLGGDLMGVLGMVIFIPISSILYALFRELVKRRLKEKNIDV